MRSPRSSFVAPAGAVGLVPSPIRSVRPSFLTLAVSASLARSTSTWDSSPFLRVKSAVTLAFGASFRSLSVGSSMPGGRSFVSGRSSPNSSVISVRKGAVAVTCSVPSPPPAVLKRTSRATTSRSAFTSFFCVLASRDGAGAGPPSASWPSAAALSISLVLNLTHLPSRTALNAPASGGRSSADGTGLPDTLPMASMSARM